MNSKEWTKTDAQDRLDSLLECGRIACPQCLGYGVIDLEWCWACEGSRVLTIEQVALDLGSVPKVWVWAA